MSIDHTRRAFFMTGRTKNVTADIHLPWIKNESHFLNNCTQCGKCIEHCPESIVVKGQGGYPKVDFTAGECTFCQECVKHCPEQLFDVNQRQPWNLTPTINEQCFTKRNILCQSCRDVCEFQAINFDVTSRIPSPEIDLSLCTGCGACVSSCPAKAISLTANSVPQSTQENTENE